MLVDKIRILRQKEREDDKMNENKKLQKPWIVQKFIGDKKFYQRVLFLAVPIMIQNGITNFVSLLDNIMIGQIGTVQMSGASIVNQLIFVYKRQNLNN